MAATLQIKQSTTASINTPEITPTPEDQTTASGSSMSDAILLDEESTSALPIPLTRSSPDHALGIIENNSEKITTGSSTPADEFFSPASTSNSVLDNSTSILSTSSTPDEVQVFWEAPPIAKN